MKKLFISMGLAAAGTSGLHAAYGPDAGDTSKIWTVSASLRAFYDDNYNTASSGKQGSLGVQISPQFQLNVPMQQTEVGLRYIYGLSYYQERDRLGENPYDQTHQFDVWLDHAFNERWQARFQDSFVVGQEPELLTQSGTGAAVLQRVSGNNISNTGKFSLNTDWTQVFSTELGYQNTFYDYQNSGGSAVNPSLAGLLDRDENLISLDSKWHLWKETTLIFGYQYGQVNYLGNEAIGAFGPTTYMSNSRDNRSHYGYVGVQHSFLDNLTGNARVGVEYTQYYNDPNSTTAVGPYANASLVYTYSEGSDAEIGLTHSRNATDQTAISATGQLTQDQESTVVYGSINQRITHKLTGSLIGNFQNSTYHGGTFDGRSDDFYSVGVNANYAFTRFFSMEAGYNFDDYMSTVPGQTYTRNRVYIGLTASY